MFAEEFSLLPSRRGDAIIKVAERTDPRVMEICGTNHAFDKLARPMDTDALMGQPLSSILGSETKAILEDVEDKAEGLKRLREFKLLLNGQESDGMDIKVVQAPPENDCFAYFIVLRDAESELVRRRQSQGLVFANLKGHEDIDEESSLPNRASFMKDLEMIQHQVRSGRVQACMALLQYDHYDAIIKGYGEALRPALAKHMASVYRTHMREYDSMSRLRENMYALLLLDAGPEEARIALNRLRTTMHAHPLVMGEQLQIAIGISTGFTEITGKFSPDERLKATRQAMMEAAADGGNLLKMA